MKLRLSLVAVVVIGLILPATSSAAFHLMKVSEIYPGDSTTPTAEFVELQMYADGQNQVGGHTVEFYEADGDLIESFAFVGAVPNGDSQSTILVGTFDADVKFGEQPDFIIDPVVPNLMDPAGGAVCFETIDCVSWGNFTGDLGAGRAAGTPAPAITDNLGLTRSIAAGCETLLEAGDDTGSSAADFDLLAPSPRRNFATPTETTCDGNGGGGGGNPDTEISADLNADKKQKGTKITAVIGAGEHAIAKLKATGKAAGKKVKLGPEKFEINGPDSTQVKLKATGKNKKLIKKAAKKGKKTKLTLKATFTDDAGNKAKLKTKVKLV